MNKRNKILLAAGIVCLIVAAGAAAWWWLGRPVSVARKPGVAPAEAPVEEPLQVLHYGPTGEDLPITTEGISVMFDRPVVPLTTLDAGRDRAIDLTIRPAVKGKFHWLGTHGFIFRPESPFDPATAYQVTVPEGIAALDGPRLPEALQWEFATVRPMVWRWTPSGGSTLLLKNAALAIHFNLAMDRGSVEEGLEILVGGQPTTVGRKYLWRDDDHSVIVQFTGELPWDTAVTARLPKGTRAKKGTLGLAADAEARYTTPERTFQVKAVSWGWGKEKILQPATDAAVEIGSGICYEFSQPIIAASFERAFRAKGKKPHFYFSYTDDFPWVDANGKMKRREGYLRGCASFIEEHNQAYQFAIDPKKIVAVSGAALEGAGEEYLVHTGHAKAGVDANLTRNILSLHGPMKLPYRVMNLRAITLRLYRLADHDVYSEEVKNENLRLKEKWDDVTKQWVPVEPLELRSIARHLQLPVDEAAWKADEFLTIDQSEMKADMTIEVPTGAAEDVSRVVAADLEQLRDKGTLTPGIYLIEAQGLPSIAKQKRPPSALSMIQFTPVGLALKREADHVLVWATDIESGRPIPDLPVTVEEWNSPKKEERQTADGTTNAEGVLILPADWSGGDNLCARVTDPARFSYTCTDEHRLTEYDRQLLSTEPHHFAYVYTDRPIYRPGQRVHFSAFIRRVKEGRYFLPAKDLACRMVVVDAAGNALYKEDLAVGAGGVVAGHVDLSGDEDLPRGTYQVRVEVRDQWFTRQFYVASYRKPTFKVDLQPERAELISGEPIAANLTGQYFFGAPMRKAKTTWSIMTSTYRFAPEGYEGFSFIDDDLLRKGGGDSRGEYDEEYESDYEYDIVAGSGREENDSQTEDPRGGGAKREAPSEFFREEGTELKGRGARLDEAGVLKIAYRPNLAKYPTSQVLTIEANVRDPANQEVAAAEDIIVHKASYYLGLKPEKWVYAEKTPATVSVASVATNGKAVGEKAYAVDVVKREYQFIEERNAQGVWEYRFEPKDTTIEHLSGSTDPAGRATATFTPPGGGTYRLVITGHDEKGRAIQAATAVYAWGAGYVPWRLDEVAKLELQPDKETYKVGETAHILVKSLVPVTKALLTLERGRLLDYRIVELSGGNAGAIDLPITEGMIPNLYVSVVAHAGRAGTQPPLLFHGETELAIAPERKRLQVSIAPDRKGTTDQPPIYRPGDQVKVHVTTKDPAGKPVQAHLAVSVADESVLRLLGYRLPDLVKRFYYRRANSVVTASSMRSLKAGDGGVSTGKKRRIFKDTAHYEAHLTTDAKGVGEFSFTLPDDLTTWVIEAVAVSEAKSFEVFEAERTRAMPSRPAGMRALDADLELTDGTFVGSERGKLMTTLPLLVRPTLPRFAVWGDRVRGAVIANNQNPVSAEGTLRVTVSGDATFADGNPAQEIPFSVPARSERTFPVELAIQSANGALTFGAEAKDREGKALDGVEVRLPVKDRYAPEIVATSGVTEATITEQIDVPKEITPEKGGITVGLKASLGLAIAKPLKFLIDFPYGCAEQRSAALLALLMARDLSGKLGEKYFDALAPVTPKEISPGMTYAEKLKLLDRKIAAIIDDLVKKFQHPDGGFVFWPEGSTKPDLYASVQVLWALTMARDLGVALPKDVLERTGAFLDRGLKKTKGEDLEGRWRVRWNRDELAYVLWGLSLVKAWEPTTAEWLIKRHADLSVTGASFLLMALANHGDRAAAKDVARFLHDRAQFESRHVNWPASEFFWASALKNTALAGWALFTYDAGDPLVSKALAYVLNREKARHFGSTQDNLYLAAIGYTFAKQMKEEQTNYVVRAAIGGTRLVEQTFTRANLLEEVTHEHPMRLVHNFPMPADFTIQKEGPGTVYYDLLLKYYLPPEMTPTREEGLIIAREYYAMDDAKETRPLTQFVVGENYKGHITLVVPKELNYVVVRDLLPAGFEPIDMTLAISSRAAQLQAQADPNRRETSWEDRWRAHLYDDVIVEEDYGSDYGFAHQEVRDDLILWSDRVVPPGVYHLRYPVRATTEGTFLAPGAEAFEFYEPEIFGRSRLRRIEIMGRSGK